MCCELPILKRCLLCIPLRYGLIGWSYIRLVIDVIVIAALTLSFIYMLDRPQSYHVGNLIMIGLIILLGIVDVALTIVFIIGAQRKNVKLLKMCYVYNIVVWGLLIIFGVAITVYTIYLMSQHNMAFFDHVFFMLTDLFTYLSQIVVQGYFLLLLRSEIIKLENTSEFQFVNNAAESECRMKWAQDGVASPQEEQTQEIHNY